MSKKNYQVLAVDDIDLMCHFMFETLSKMPGFSCRTATEFATAEAILNDTPIDMAIIDIHLKNASGLTLAKKIRCGKYACRHDIPILIFSINTYKEEIQQCIAFDVQDIMAKPFSSGSLKERVTKSRLKENKIKALEYYCGLEAKGAGPEPQEPRKVKVAITKSSQQAGSAYRPKHSNSASETLAVESHAFVRWPEGVGSGYHQIDRRLKSITLQLNALHWGAYNNISGKDGAKDVHEIRLACDDLLHISRQLSEKHAADTLWQELNDRLKQFKRIPLDKMTGKEPSKQLLDELFKKVHSSWLTLLCKPILKRETI